MFARIMVLFAGLLAALPAMAEEMRPDEAHRFVVGKLFSYACFDGTRGAGRIYSDGSVAGSIQFRGQGQSRYVALPSGTLKVKGESICASVRGVFFEPCFNLNKTDSRSFRGSVSGMNFAYCQFTRRGGRANFAAATLPRRLEASAKPRRRNRGGADHARSSRNGSASWAASPRPIVSMARPCVRPAEQAIGQRYDQGVWCGRSRGAARFPGDGNASRCGLSAQAAA